MTIQVGESREFPFSITSQQVAQFAELTGDFNPVHLDAEAAKAAGFKGPIAHGILSASVFSRILGTQWPGEGTVYTQQMLDFKRALYPEAEYVAKLACTEIDPKSKLVKFNTEVWLVKPHKIVIGGWAEVFVPSLEVL